MKTFHSLHFALLAAATAVPLVAAPPKAPPKAAGVPVELVLESTAANVVLPSGVNGIVVFRECQACAPKSLRTSASTTYRFNQQELTLQEFRATLSRAPTANINVVVSGRTRELIALNALSETPITAPRKKSK